MRKMRLTKTLLVAFLLLFVSVWLKAQERTSDYLYVGASGGYGTLIGSVEEMSVPGLASGGVNVGYEMRHSHLLLRVGAVGQYVGSRCNTELTVGDVRIEDTRYGLAWMHYKMLSPLEETQNFFAAGLELMVGYSANDYQDSRIHGGFYVMGGVKVLVRCAEVNSVKLKYETTATYDRYIDDYEDMPNHYYETKEVTASPKFGFWGYVAASVELGWELNVNGYDKLKIGVYGDCGFTNVMAGQKVTKVQDDGTDPSVLVVDSYYRSAAMEGRYVVPLAAGVKVAYAWNMNRVRNCRGKNCLPYRNKRR